MNRSLLALLSLAVASTLHASPLEDAEKLLKAGNTDAAIKLMREQVGKNETDPYLLYNFGLVLYRAGNYDEALHVFQGIEAPNDKELQSKAALQMGNIQYHLAQKLLNAGPASAPGAILSMERALGYYETANEIEPRPDSKSNQHTATVQLGNTLLNQADYEDKHAVGYSAANNLHFEEVSLRKAIQARQRAAELDPTNAQLPSLIAGTTQRLIANLTRQGDQASKEADEAKDIKVAKARRKQAIGFYDNALQLDPANSTLVGAREDQVKKMSSLLTDEAEALAAPLLPKPALDLDPKEQAILEVAKTKLDDALSLDAANTRATDLKQQIVAKLVESYVAQGDKALATINSTPAAKDKLDLDKTAIDQYQKALNLDPQNQPALTGMQKAQAMLADLYAAAGKEDLTMAKGMMTPASGGDLSPKGLSNKDLDAVTTALQTSVLNLGTAVAMKPGETSWQKDLAEAQALLDLAIAETDKRNLANNKVAPPPPGGGGSEAPAGGMLPLSLNNSPKPLTESKFWDGKVRDW